MGPRSLWALPMKVDDVRGNTAPCSLTAPDPKGMVGSAWLEGEKGPQGTPGQPGLRG